MVKTAQNIIEERRILAEAKAGMRREKIAQIKRGFKTVGAAGMAGVKTVGEIGAGFIPKKVPAKRWKALTRLRPAPQLSQEQAMLREMFGSGRTWGTGESLPQIRGELRTGYGLINNEDFGETRSMFGLS